MPGLDPGIDVLLGQHGTNLSPHGEERPQDASRTMQARSSPPILRDGASQPSVRRLRLLWRLLQDEVEVYEACRKLQEQMKIEAPFFCRRGRKQTNDDSVLPLLNTNGAWWAAVADGMGGHPGGALASSRVINVIRTEIESSSHPDIAGLFSIAQQSLSVLAAERPEFASMGTTLSLIRLTPSGGEIGHVGDSRIYQLRSEGIVARTVDQTEVEQLVQRGVLTRADARYYPRRNILLSVLSASADYRLQRERFDIRARDRFVLVTDGVTENLLDEEIRDLSLGAKDAEAFCDAIQEQVENRSPRDDYSAVCLEILEL